MKRKIAYLIDSTLVTDLAYIEQSEDFFLMPLCLVKNGQMYRDMLDITVTDFYEEVRKGVEMTTSQSSVGEFLDKLHEIKELGYTDVLIFPIGSNLSGTIQSAQTAASMVEGMNSYVIDTKTVTAVGGVAIRHIAKYAQTTNDMSDILAYAHNIFDHINIYAVIYTLDALKKGGRISPAKAAIASVLNIMPIIQIHHGVIDVIGKERTNKKCIQKLIEQLKARPFRSVIILHSDMPDLRDQLIAVFEANFPDCGYEVANLSPVIGVHTGPEAAGYGIIWE